MLGARMGSQSLPINERKVDRALVSLFELMYEYSISDLVLMLSGLLTASHMLKYAKSPHEAIPDQEWLQQLSVAIDGLHILAEQIEMDMSLVDQIAKLREVTGREKCELPANVIKDTAADHCEYMQDIWRNETAHARRTYNKSESLAALNRVREFVTALANTEADA